MSINQKIVDKLDHYKRYNNKLTCTWDAGGDDTVIHFQLDGKKLSYGGSQEFLFTLREIIADKLDLPNAGEYYNQGIGKIFLNDDDQILIQYDEFAYFELEDDFVQSNLELLVEHTFPSIKKRKYPIIINGTIELESHILTDDIDFYCKEEPAIIPRKEKAEIEEFIKQELSKNLVWNKKDTAVSYFGSIESDLLLIQEVYLTKFKVDKNNLKKITVLY